MIWIFPIVFTASLTFGVFAELFPISSVIAFAPLPLVILAGLGLKKNYNDVDLLFPSMSKTLMFSRLSGILFVIGILIGL